MKKQSGFTLPEIIIVTAVVGIIALVISQFYANRLTDYAREFTQTQLQASTKQALETMERDLKNAQYVEANNNLTNSYNSSGWTSGTSVLVVQVPALDSSDNPIYIDGQHTQIWSNEVIYFVNGGVLYRRILANPNAPGNTAVSSCPTGTGGGCPNDGKVIEDVASMSLVYYDDTNQITTLPNLVHTVQATLQRTKSSFGRQFTSTLTTSTTLRNR